MIIDKIDNAARYYGISKRIQIALEYLQYTDFSQKKIGKYAIENDAIFALVNEYSTKDASESLLEGHRAYIDVQYLVEGSEQMGVATFENQLAVKAYDPEDDYQLFREAYALIPLKKGMFAIFFPDDLHMPGIHIGKPAVVKKVVVKVRV